MNVRMEQIGDATLYLGDCRYVLPTLGKVDAVVTDPPYGVELTRKTGASFQASTIYKDSPDYVRALIKDTIGLALQISDRAAIFCGNRMLFDYPRPASIGTAYVSSGAGCDPWGFGCNNPILYYGKCPYLAIGKGSRPNSFSDNRSGDAGIDHPCPKPLAWMKWLVNRVSLPSHTILDPFMGSGTTGVACVKLDRKFIGIEIEPKYFDIACRRIEEATRQPKLFAEPVAKAVQQDMLS